MVEKCPSCGKEIPEVIEDENGEPMWENNSVSFKTRCGNCGKELHHVYIYEGIFDPETEEYL